MLQQETWHASSPKPKPHKAPTGMCISSDLAGTCLDLPGSLSEAMPLQNSSSEFLGEADVAGLRNIFQTSFKLAFAIAAGSTARKISDTANKIICEEEEIEQIQQEGGLLYCTYLLYIICCS